MINVNMRLRYDLLVQSLLCRCYCIHKRELFRVYSCTPSSAWHPGPLNFGCYQQHWSTGHTSAVLCPAHSPSTLACPHACPFVPPSCPQPSRTETTIPNRCFSLPCRLGIRT